VFHFHHTPQQLYDCSLCASNGWKTSRSSPLTSRLCSAQEQNALRPFREVITLFFKAIPLQQYINGKKDTVPYSTFLAHKYSRSHVFYTVHKNLKQNIKCVRSELFWDIIQCIAVIPYWRFGTIQGHRKRWTGFETAIT